MMDIDDEFSAFMKLVHPDLSPESPQYAISRNVFFGGMMAMYKVLNTGGSAKHRVRVLMDVRTQLARHATRATQGMEPGFTTTNFGS